MAYLPRGIGAATGISLVSSGGIVVQGPRPTYAGPGCAVEFSGGLASLLGYDATLASYLPFILIGSSVNFAPNGSILAVVSSTGLTCTNGSFSGTLAVTGTTTLTGNVTIARGGQTILIAGTRTITDASITAKSVVHCTPVGVINGGSLGVTLTAGTGFQIDSTNMLDTRIVNYNITERP